MKQIITGVHTLLELLFRESDLLYGLPSFKRLEEGIEGHKKVQLSRPAEYRPEVPVEFASLFPPYEVIIRGRIDGIYEYEDYLRVEEIKTTYSDLSSLSPETHPYYMAQLKLYMYFLSELYPDKKISGVLTYFSLKNSLTREFEVEYERDDFKAFFEGLVKCLIEIEKREDRWKEKRNTSLKNLVFPFPELRKGQKDLMDKVISVIDSGTSLLVEAPTGIGKTAAVLFPSVKKLDRDLYDKIFFLTAKTPGQNIVRETLELFREKGLSLRSIFLNAKEKMCFCEECICDPLLCKYAKGYYDRLTSAVEEILAEEIFIRDLILDKAEKHKICPFEFSLDLSLYCDLIVCDYNYVFDPRVFLRRYFAAGNSRYLFLIDEAHNLVTRGRDMYSASIDKKSVLDLKRGMKGINPDLFEIFDDINRQFILWNKEMKKKNLSFLSLEHVPQSYGNWKEAFFDLAEEYFRSGEIYKPQLKDFYYEFRAFISIMKLLSEDFSLFVKREGENLIWKIFCLNPGKEIARKLRRAHSAVFFSATLTPGEYFKELLGLPEEREFFSLPSPFPPENAVYLHIPGISTTYKQREYYYDAVVSHIKRIIALKPGNYLAFFPSYRYLQDIYSRLESDEEIEILLQERGMTENDRDAFLEKFIPSEKILLGMVVMGGLFGEAIDLPGERLIGAIITGVGLPMVDEEQELIFKYFEAQEKGKGFLYSYMIPGMIRVVQSAGRVLRTPEDRGIIVLLDERFRYSGYRRLLPRSWLTTGRAFSTQVYERFLTDFWYGEKK